MVHGLDRLNRRFRRIPERLKRAAKAALEKGADDIVRAQKAFAPQDDGTLQDTIRHSPAAELAWDITRYGGSDRGAAFAAAFLLASQ